MRSCHYGFGQLQSWQHLYFKIKYCVFDFTVFQYPENLI